MKDLVMVYSRVLAAVVVWVSAGAVFAGCHLIFPFTVEQADGGVVPDTTSVDLARADLPRDMPRLDMALLDKGPEQDATWNDVAPLDTLPKDAPPPDGLPPDTISPDTISPDTISPDTVPPICYTSPSFDENFGLQWTINMSSGGKPVAKSTYIEFPTGVGGGAVRADPKGLFCAPSGTGLQISFTRYCTTGKIYIRLYDTYCLLSGSCPVPLFTCSSTCSYSAATTTEVCFINKTLGSNKPIYTVMVYRPGGSSKATANHLNVSTTP